MDLCEREVHGGAVMSVAWLDGGGFATGGEEGMVGMWSSVTGECAARLTGHTHAVTCLLHVETAQQGRRVVSGSRDRSVRVWKIEGNMGRTSQTLSGHTDHVTALAFATSSGKDLESSVGSPVSTP
jgi:WD40 repeat protein